MNTMSTVFRVGAWRVDSSSGEITSEGNVVRLEARTARLLSYLAARAGEVVSIDDMLDNVWAGVMVTPDSVYQAIASLRRSLGDDPKQPGYIATVPRYGYRLIASVELGDGKDDASSVAEAGDAAVTVLPFIDPAAPAAVQSPVQPRRRLNLRVTAVLGLAVAILSSVVWMRATGSVEQAANQPTASTQKDVLADVSPKARSIAVLPLLDLTDEMNEEPFADGMSEELIGKLSKVPGLAVSPPTSSFYFKDKQVTIAEVSKALHAEFILDGSVRKSGSTLRVSARLTRAQDGFVIWSETYDRSWSDKLMIQDDIASEVAKALATSIH